MPESQLNWPSTLYLGGRSYLSPPTKHHVGIVDSDDDHIPDILDTLPIITNASTDGSNSATGTLAMSGTCGVTTLDNPSGGNDITICTISSAYYRINGGEQISITEPDDGAYGGYTEDFAISLNHLFKGTYTIDVYTVNSVGNVSAAQRFTFTSTLTPPDLVITKTHAGDFTQGQKNVPYSIIVSNAGVDGTPTYGKVTLVDNLPAGMTYANFSGDGWTLDSSSTPSRPKFTRSDPLGKDASYPTLTLYVDVAVDRTKTTNFSLTNVAIVSGGGEVNTVNDTATNLTTILPPADLTITKTHTGTFTQGDHGRTFTIIVSNNNAGSTVEPVTVVDVLPAGLHAVSMSGSGWTVDLATMTATRSDLLPGMSSYPALTVTVDVDMNATGTLTNLATVSGGGELITSNDNAADSVSIIPLLGFTPERIRAAYGIDQIEADGTGQTVAIVVPYRVSSIISDLQRFSSQFDAGPIQLSRRNPHRRAAHF